MLLLLMEGNSFFNFSKNTVEAYTTIRRPTSTIGANQCLDSMLTSEFETSRCP